MEKLISLNDALVSQLVEELAHTGVWTSSQVLKPSEVEQIASHARDAFSNEKFRPAQVGRGASKQQVESIRSDQIMWIEDWNAEPFAPFARFLEDLQSVCRQELYLPVKRFEGHLARYETGAFYKRHSDRHRGQPHRLISVLLYLNDLKPEAGGALTLFKEDGSELRKIQPQKGMVAVFRSETEHEVALTEQDRWSLTSWLRDDV